MPVPEIRPGGACRSAALSCGNTAGRHATAGKGCGRFGTRFSGSHAAGLVAATYRDPAPILPSSSEGYGSLNG